MKLSIAIISGWALVVTNLLYILFSSEATTVAPLLIGLFLSFIGVIYYLVTFGKIKTTFNLVIYRLNVVVFVLVVFQLMLGTVV